MWVLQINKLGYDNVSAVVLLLPSISSYPNLLGVLLQSVAVMPSKFLLVSKYSSHFLSLDSAGLLIEYILWQLNGSVPCK